MLELKNNPWLGLASYQVEDSALFFGREHEVASLDGTIRQNYSTVIYGKSGMGKTSLINAGLIPMLNGDGFLPLSLKLEHNAAESYGSQIIEAVKARLEASDAEIESLADLGEEVPERCRLWTFFHLNNFWSADNHRLIPVVFVDQFEEIFTITENKADIVAFFDMLGELFHPLPPDEISALIEENGLRVNFSENANFRLVLAMREDFLARLEDYSYNIPFLRKNRVGLAPMNGLQALEVMMKPVPGLVDRDSALEIIKKITKAGHLEDDADQLGNLAIETFLLSLFCSQLYKKAIELHRDKITPDLIRQFGDNIISDYYAECMAGISGKSLKYLEEHLLTASGYRNMLAYEDVVPRYVSAQEIAHLERCRLIRIEIINRTERIEFTHDVLCSVASSRKLKNKQRKESWRRGEAMTCNILELVMYALMCVIFMWAATEDINPKLILLLNRIGIPETLTHTLMLLGMAITMGVAVFALALRSTMISSSEKSKSFSWFAYGFDWLIGSSAEGLFILLFFTSDSDSYSMIFIMRFFLGILELYELIRSFSKPVKVPFSRMWQASLLRKNPVGMTATTVKEAIAMSYLMLLITAGKLLRPETTLFVLLGAVPFLLLLLSFKMKNIHKEKKSRPLFIAAGVGILALYLSQFLRPAALTWLIAAALLYLAFRMVSVLLPTRSMTLKTVAAAALWLLFFVTLPTIGCGYNFWALGRNAFEKSGRIEIEYAENTFKERYVIVRGKDGRQGALDRLGRVMLPVEFESIGTAGTYGFSDTEFPSVIISNNGNKLNLADYIQYRNWFTIEYTRNATKAISNDVNKIIRDAKKTEERSSEDSTDRSNTVSGNNLSQAMDDLYDKSGIVSRLLNPAVYLRMARWYDIREEADRQYLMLARYLQTSLAVQITKNFLEEGNWSSSKDDCITSLAGTLIYLHSGCIYSGYVDRYKEYLMSSTKYQEEIRRLLYDVNAEDFMTGIVDGGEYDEQVISILNEAKFQVEGLRNEEFNSHVLAVYERIGNDINTAYAMEFMGKYEQAKDLAASTVESLTGNDRMIAATNLATSLLLLGKYDEAEALMEEYRDSICYNYGYGKFFGDWVLRDLQEMEEIGITGDIPAAEFRSFVNSLKIPWREEYTTAERMEEYGLICAVTAPDLSVPPYPFGFDMPGKVFLTDRSGRRLTPDFDDIFVGNEFWDINRGWSCDPIIIYSVNGKRGFYDLSKRKYITEAVYDHAWIFSEGLAAVASDGKLGFIDESGELVIPMLIDYVPGFDYVFKDGFAKVFSPYDEDGRSAAGLIDRMSRLVLPMEYDFISDIFKNGMRVLRKREEFILIDRHYNELYRGPAEPLPWKDNYVLLDDALNLELTRQLEGDWSCDMGGGIVLELSINMLSDIYPWFSYFIYLDGSITGFTATQCRFFRYGDEIYCYESGKDTLDSWGRLLHLGADSFELQIVDNGNTAQAGQRRKYIREEE